MHGSIFRLTCDFRLLKPTQAARAQEQAFMLGVNVRQSALKYGHGDLPSSYNPNLAWYQERIVGYWFTLGLVSIDVQSAWVAKSALELSKDPRVLAFIAGCNEILVEVVHDVIHEEEQAGGDDFNESDSAVIIEESRLAERHCPDAEDVIQDPEVLLAVCELDCLDSVDLRTEAREYAYLSGLANALFTQEAPSGGISPRLFYYYVRRLWKDRVIDRGTERFWHHLVVSPNSILKHDPRVIDYGVGWQTGFSRRASEAC
jgi:hypothetical protein